MGLKLELKPGEKFVLNGAVITVGRAGASLVLNNKATILRGRDVMQAEDANTPARRLYFSIMLMYIAPEAHDVHRANFDTFWADLAEAAETRTTKALLDAIHAQVEDGDHYRAMKLCRQLIEHESKLLQPALEPV